MKIWYLPSPLTLVINYISGSISTTKLAKITWTLWKCGNIKMKRIFLDEDLIFVISFSTCYQLYSSISTTKLAKITGTLLEAVENII